MTDKFSEKTGMSQPQNCSEAALISLTDLPSDDNNLF